MYNVLTSTKAKALEYKLDKLVLFQVWEMHSKVALERDTADKILNLVKSFKLHLKWV